MTRPPGWRLLSRSPDALADLGLGVAAVVASMLADFYGRAIVNAVRFQSGRWRSVARRSMVRGAGGD